MFEVRQNRDFPEQFSVLTTNESVDGGGWRDVVCRVRERRICGTFWDIWVRGSDRFQVAEDRGSLESYGRRRELFHITSVRSLSCADLCEVVERPSDLNGMHPGSLNRWLYLRYLFFEKPPPQVDLSPFTQRSQNLRVGRLGISPAWQIGRILQLLLCAGRSTTGQS